MRRLITIEIDAGAELCGACWFVSPDHPLCEAFARELEWTEDDSDHRRRPECLAAEVDAALPAPPAAHGARYEVADEDPS